MQLLFIKHNSYILNGLGVTFFRGNLSTSPNLRATRLLITHFLTLNNFLIPLLLRTPRLLHVDKNFDPSFIKTHHLLYIDKNSGIHVY